MSYDAHLCVCGHAKAVHAMTLGFRLAGHCYMRRPEMCGCPKYVAA